MSRERRRHIRDMRKRFVKGEMISTLEIADLKGNEFDRVGYGRFWRIKRWIDSWRA